MPLFEFNPENTLDSTHFYAELEQLAKVEENASTTNGEGVAVLERGVKKEVKRSALADQFIVFQLNNTENGQSIKEASMVDPLFEGSVDEPDMNLSIQLQSFHLSKTEEVDRNSRVTMRLIIGKDSNSRDRFFDNVFWTISAGLDLFNQYKNQPAKPHEFKTDLTKALGNRPIEIPGGLANMTFELALHRNPKWWQRVFGFLQSQTGQQLTSVIGFPAITQSAIKVLDELFNRFDKDGARPLFKSRSMVLALSKQAKMDYTAGNPRIRMGSLNPGFCIMARGKDYKTISSSDAYYYPHYGLLVPANVPPAKIVTQDYEDPFQDITYAVFKVGMSPLKLNTEYFFGTPMA